MDQLLEQMGINNSEQHKINQIKAPMPGRIVNIAVTVGKQVQKGDTLIVLEAIKMENALKAPSDAFVKSISIQ